MNKSETTKRKILDNSLELFVRKGYAATTTRSIADKSEIAVGLLFHYFPTKEAILETLIDEASSGIEQIVPIFMTEAQPDKIFMTVCDFLVESLNHNENLSLFLLVSQTMALDFISFHIREKCNKSHYAHATAEVIRQGQELGLFRSIDALSLSYTFWGAIQGIAEMKYLYADYTIPPSEVLYSILKK